MRTLLQHLLHVLRWIWTGLKLLLLLLLAPFWLLYDRLRLWHYRRIVRRAMVSQGVPADVARDLCAELDWLRGIGSALSPRR